VGVPGYYCPTHYATGIDKELELIDAQDTALPTDFVVVRKRKEPAQCDHLDCHDSTRIFVTRGHYDGPNPDVDQVPDEIKDIEDIEPPKETTSENQAAPGSTEKVPTGVLESGTP